MRARGSAKDVLNGADVEHLHTAVSVRYCSGRSAVDGRTGAAAKKINVKLCSMPDGSRKF
jgi:hypothetical protein